VGFRNILVHGYTSIDNSLVWQLATSKVPLLLSEITDLLSDNEPRAAIAPVRNQAPPLSQRLSGLSGPAASTTLEKQGNPGHMVQGSHSGGGTELATA